MKNFRKKKNKNDNIIISAMLFLIVFLKAISNTIDLKINEKTKDKYKNYQLIDVIHSFTPNIKIIQNFFHLLNFLLFLFIFFHKKINTIIFLKKIFKIQCFHFFCNYSTILPSLNNCDSSIFHSCHNLIFSSNVAMILLYSLYLYELYPFIKIYLILFLFIYSILLVSSRMHYTVDVILGLYISYNIFYE